MAVQAEKFVLPTRPYSIIDALNRRALATGGHRNAIVAADANYNGHHVRVRWNDYRSYWIASYFWGGDRVLARGSLVECLKAAVQEYSIGARGASAEVEVTCHADADAARAAGFIPEAEEDLSWRDWKFEELSSAMLMDRHGMPRTHHLIAATDQADYSARVEADRQILLSRAGTVAHA